MLDHNFKPIDDLLEPSCSDVVQTIACLSDTTVFFVETPYKTNVGVCRLLLQYFRSDYVLSFFRLRVLEKEAIKHINVKVPNPYTEIHVGKNIGPRLHFEPKTLRLP